MIGEKGSKLLIYKEMVGMVTGIVRLSKFRRRAERSSWLRERGWDPADENTALTWIEAFADRTTEAVKRRDAEAVRAQTNFIAAAYRAEPDA
jgi:hypothetical protein